MTQIGVESLVMHQSVPSLQLLLVCLIDYPLGDCRLGGNLLRQRGRWEFDDIPSSALESPFGFLFPSTSVDISHLCLLIEVARFRTRPRQLKLLQRLPCVHCIADVELFQAWL